MACSSSRSGCDGSAVMCRSRSTSSTDRPCRNSSSRSSAVACFSRTRRQADTTASTIQVPATTPTTARIAHGGNRLSSSSIAGPSPSDSPQRARDFAAVVRKLLMGFAEPTRRGSHRCLARSSASHWESRDFVRGSGTRGPARVARDTSIREQSRSPHEELPMPRDRMMWSVLAALFLSLLHASARAEEYDLLKVGVQPDGRIVVPTNQVLHPAGKQIVFPGRPVDLAFAEDGKTLVVKNLRDLVFIDVVTGEIKQTLRQDRKRPGFSVVGLVVIGDLIYASDAEEHVRVARRQKDGKYTWEDSLGVEKPKKVKGDPHPAGITRLGDRDLLVTATRCNSVQRIDRVSDKVKEEVAVGVAPYTVCLLSDTKAYVSNWGGDPPGEGDPQGTSSGTPVRIDPRTGVASHGSISVLINDGGWKQIRTIRVGLHPSGMAVSARASRVYVANANSDTVSVIDTKTDRVIETIRCRPTGRLPFGSGCNAVALSPDGETLYVANGTNNCVAVVRLGEKAAE